ncbi:GDNF family receptor alpha-like [Plectropomus leopardus]|uniref:GDNF family receptor alpha-like n=1 Tax=Plectropomus leopardus TaxID=160734 RepID=UPI001C4C8CE1|nr:GDNF family receptor alpha-like [Plectropomus leopardus]
MQLIRLETAVILGIIVVQISSISFSSAPSDCLAAVDTCMSNLCKWSKEAFNGNVCEDEECQIKGSEICNLTIHTVLNQFPSLHMCVCAWEEELCDSIQALATQCHQKPGAQQKRSTMMDWQSSSLIGYVPDGAGSCLDQVTICISDAVCNRYLAPVLQACTAQQCDRCQQVTQQFYGSMPRNVAEMLVMCECEASDQFCLPMKTALHSGTCREETWFCQDTVNQCVDDSYCRDLLRTLRVKCWSPEEAQCSDSDLQNDECFSQMDPALMLGANSECKTAFLATMGTALHYPCTCEGMRNDDHLKCNMIRDVFHNRSHFKSSWKSGGGSTKPPATDESEQGLTWSHDYLLYGFATVLLIGVVILMPLAVISKICMLKRRDKTKFHHPKKNNCVVII